MLAGKMVWGSKKFIRLKAANKQISTFITRPVIQKQVPPIEALHALLGKTENVVLIQACCRYTTLKYK